MGGIRKYMPITYWTSLLGSLALIGFPGFAGFFSKDAIIEAVHHSTIAGSSYAYVMVVAGVFVTALYSFRMFFLVFHGEGPRNFHPHHDVHDEHGDAEAQEDHHVSDEPTPHESPWVVWVPLVMLAIPSVVIGYLTVGDMLFGDFFKGVIYVAPEHDVLAAVGANYHGELGFILHGMMAPPFFLAMGGLFVAWFVYMKKPELADMVKKRLSVVYNILDKKYFFDNFNQIFFAAGSRGIGHVLFKAGDRFLIDGLVVNGSAKTVGWISGIVRHVQTGYLYHYAFAIIVGMLGLLAWFVTA